MLVRLNFSATVYQRVNKYESLCSGWESHPQIEKFGKATGLVDAAYNALFKLL